MDAAASSVGATLPLPMRVEKRRLQKAEEEAAAVAAAEEKDGTKVKLIKAGDTLDFLKDNIGIKAIRKQEAEELMVLEPADVEDEDDDWEDVDLSPPELVLADDMEELRNVPDDARMATFQAQYKLEMERQANLLELPDSSPRHAGSMMTEEDEDLLWEDGEML
jgi:hypothetical protein